MGTSRLAIDGSPWFEGLLAPFVIASAAKQSIPPQIDSGLLRRFASRNDGVSAD
jgi:hypothetical protein